MKPNFKVLYYLDNTLFSLLEIKRTDLEGEPDKSKIYHWLRFDKESKQIQKLDFVSMNTSGSAEERIFKQGKLHFNSENGLYKSEGQTTGLTVLPATNLPETITKGIEEYLEHHI